MKRRDFLALSGLGVAGAFTASTFSGCASIPRRRPGDLFGLLVAQNDARVPGVLESQQLDPSHPHVGGVPDRYGMYQAGPASGLIRTLALAYTLPESRYTAAAELVERMASAARFLRRMQHDDGTIDLITTNFHSPPDTGFVMEWICSATGLLRRANRPELRDALADLDRFILGAAGAMTVGGVHTPNHRWVVSMALARANALHPNPAYVARIDEWLAEGIDIDADGQFTERSTSVYSPLTDRCLITLARLLDRPALLEPVRRNLEMTLHYTHADGEVATEGSKRQDQYRRGSLAPYYYAYRYMAIRDASGRFAAMARRIEAIAPDRLTRDLVFFAEDPVLRRAMPISAQLPTNYEKHFSHSGLVRIRRDRISATVLAENPTFFSLHKGSAAVVVRFASAFFGKGQFVGDALDKDGASWVMTQELKGPYLQPLTPEQRRADGDWTKMPKANRRQSEVQQLTSRVRITERGAGFDIEFEIAGTEAVPVAIELGFRPGGELTGDLSPAGDRAFVLQGGAARYRLGGDEIRVGPVVGESRRHRWTQLRGAHPKLEAESVYFTGFTPFRAKVRFA